MGGVEEPGGGEENKDYGSQGKAFYLRSWMACQGLEGALLLESRAFPGLARHP